MRHRLQRRITRAQFPPQCRPHDFVDFEPGEREVAWSLILHTEQF